MFGTVAMTTANDCCGSCRRMIITSALMFIRAQKQRGLRGSKGTAPDLGEVGGDNVADNVIWDAQSRLLTVSVETNAWEQQKTHKVNFTIAPTEFVRCDR